MFHRIVFYSKAALGYAVKRLRSRRIFCHCGGQIIEYFEMDDFFFACDRCEREITDDQFEMRYR